jgi:cell division protein FtsQ
MGKVMSAFPREQLKYKLAVVEKQDQRLLRLAIWRSCIVMSCAVSLFLIALSPYWQIKHQYQVQIRGDKLVAKDTIHNFLKLSYPQFIWTIRGSNLTKKIESIPAIAAAKVTKQIIPPTLIIAVQERIPVALALSFGKVGFLDEKGKWISQEFYGSMNANFPLPKLKVINYQPQYRDSWSKIYQLISLYPALKINEIRWEQSGSLFLKTAIGTVYLGSDLSRLKKQFDVMARLTNLPAHFERSKIAYIDLSNPDLNLIQQY